MFQRTLLPQRHSVLLEILGGKHGRYVQIDPGDSWAWPCRWKDDTPVGDKRKSCAGDQVMTMPCWH